MIEVKGNYMGKENCIIVDRKRNNRYCLLCILLNGIFILLLSSCSKYNDSDIRSDINDLQKRIATLEELSYQFNNNISSLQTLVDAFENSYIITGFDTLYERAQPIGYSILFKNGKKIVIYHGKDGNDGIDGNDGLTPIIGIAQDEADGNWYWTLNGEWLLDANNLRVRANGIDGKNGDDGVDAIAPQLKIGTDGYWYISTDSGVNWTKLEQATGEPGKNGDSMFEDIYYDESTIYFVLKGGVTIPLRINLSKETDALWDEIYVENYESIGNADFWLDKASPVSDMTWCGNRLIGFTSSSDDLETSTGSIYIDVYDNGIKEARTARYYLKHYWGHCNTVDYNPYNDCLILGNGSGSYQLEGKIIIIPNFSSIINISSSSSTPKSLLDVNALVIDCNGYNLGSKFNLVWGDDNDMNYNIAYLITANIGGSGTNGGDLETIRKIVLKKGSDIGFYGSIVNNSTPFNGTFDIVETSYQKTAGYANCDQGTCYYKGEILAAVGHDGAWYWRMRMSNSKIYRRSYKQKTYYPNKTTNYGNSTGICTKDGFMFMGRAGLGIMAIRL